jgi:hypothetical protein
MEPTAFTPEELAQAEAFKKVILSIMRPTITLAVAVFMALLKKGVLTKEELDEARAEVEANLELRDFAGMFDAYPELRQALEQWDREQPEEPRE